MRSRSIRNGFMGHSVFVVKFSNFRKGEEWGGGICWFGGGKIMFIYSGIGAHVIKFENFAGD